MITTTNICAWQETYRNQNQKRTDTLRENIFNIYHRPRNKIPSVQRTFKLEGQIVKNQQENGKRHERELPGKKMIENSP